VNLTEDVVIRNGFCVAVSMHDGMVMQTTASIKNVLGYPKEFFLCLIIVIFIIQNICFE
jgi:hypothetical protein